MFHKLPCSKWTAKKTWTSSNITLSKSSGKRWVMFSNTTRLEPIKWQGMVIFSNTIWCEPIKWQEIGDILQHHMAYRCHSNGKGWVIFSNIIWHVPNKWQGMDDILQHHMIWHVPIKWQGMVDVPQHHKFGVSLSDGKEWRSSPTSHGLT